MAPIPHYIIAARRTALGRVGGLHRNRRVADLAVPIIEAVLCDAHLNPQDVDELIVGNTLEGGNPARLVALTAGLSASSSAYSIDRLGASGLDAIVAAVRTVVSGDANVVIAGGVEAVSTAPWRVAKPKSLNQLPYFIAPDGTTSLADSPALDALEVLARQFSIGRDRQDHAAFESFLRAKAAREGKKFVGEIVPIRATVDEARDQSAVEPQIEDLEGMTPFLPREGTLTPGNTSAPHDGAAFVAVVSGSRWDELGRPPALRMIASSAVGVASGMEARAVIEAMSQALRRNGTVKATEIGNIEISESSMAEQIALARALGVEPHVINRDGGAVVRGHPLAAAGAVSVVRLFSGLLRSARPGDSRIGAAAAAAGGGQGVAVLLEAVT